MQDPISFEFAGHVLDLRRLRLQKSGRDVALRPKSLALLVYLIRNSGRVIAKDELIAAIWSGTAVTDESLTQCVRDIRKTLGQEGHGLIRTVPRRGYVADEERILATGYTSNRQAAATGDAVGFNSLSPRTLYAKSGDVSVAYQVLGDGPVDLVFAQGWITHLEYAWTNPDFARFLTRLASFSRLIRFDRRGMGLSDRDTGSWTLEERVDDIRAVMDSAGSERATILGGSEGGYMAAVFAATHPERTTSLILYGCFARGSSAPDYPWCRTMEECLADADRLQRTWSEPFNLEEAAPSVAHEPGCSEWFSAYLRSAVSPGAVKGIEKLIAEMDVRSILPTIRVPTLVLHRTADRWLKVEEARYLATHIPGAKLIELQGRDHIPWWGDQLSLIAEIERFVRESPTGFASDRALLTVLATQIDPAEMAGTHSELLVESVVRRLLRDFECQQTNTTDDGFVASFTGPIRAIQCAVAIVRDLRCVGINVRIGLHAGECERCGNEVRGPAAQVASRIANQSSPARILVSSTVRDLVVGSGIEFMPAGAPSTNGVLGPLHWVLDGQAIGPTR